MRIILRDPTIGWKLSPWVGLVGAVLFGAALWYGIFWVLMAVWPDGWR